MIKKIIAHGLAIMIFITLPNILAETTGASYKKEKLLNKYLSSEKTVSYTSDKFYLQETNKTNTFGVYQMDLWVPLPASLRTKEFLKDLEYVKVSGEDWAPIHAIQEKLQKAHREYQIVYLDTKGKEISYKKAKRKPIISNLDLIIFSFGAPNTELPSSPWTDTWTVRGFYIMAVIQFLLMIRSILVYQQDKRDGYLQLGREKSKNTREVHLDKSDELYLEEEDYEKYHTLK